MHSRVDTALYPETEPWFQRWLAVGDGHELYVEQSGNPDGLPVLVLHGGPGGGCSPHMRRYFDPSRWRIILFDQRGAGRSRPMGGLQANTTEHLLADMALIRRELGIERWMLFGGSWGSTLALLYAQRYPEQVSALVLRGVFLCRREDMDWLYRDGASRIYPEAWASFVGGVPAAEAGDLVAAYYRRLCDDSDPALQQSLAMRWAGWEGACATLLPSPAVLAGFHARALALARIEAHYFAHQGFMPAGGVLAGMPALAQVPGIIVHGRYDMVCPVDQALLLQQHWPAARLEIVPDAGHSASEPSLERALVAAAQALASEVLS